MRSRPAQQGTSGVTYADEVFPRDAVAALANNDPDYPGSCGRCYEVRCHTGPVIANGTSIYRTDEGCAGTVLVKVPVRANHQGKHTVYLSQASHAPGFACGSLCVLRFVLTCRRLQVQHVCARTQCNG